MKKLLAIMVLGLLWCNSSYAKNITLNKCKDTEYDSLMYEKYYYIIDLKKKEITKIKEEFDFHPTNVLDKIEDIIKEFKIFLKNK